MERILAEYQVDEDPRGNQTAFTVELVEAEWDVLIEHACGERIAITSFKNGGCGPIDTLEFFSTMEMVGHFKDMANAESEKRYPGENVAGGRRDAYRHTYLNALITRQYGAKFAFDLTTAHERNVITSDVQEAMDLYNNEQGRLAAAAIGGRPSDWVNSADHIQNLVESGEVLAIAQDFDQNGTPVNHRLVPSNQVPRGYLYMAENAGKNRPSVDPSRVPCGTTVGGRCADR